MFERDRRHKYALIGIGAFGILAMAGLAANYRIEHNVERNSASSDYTSAADYDADGLCEGPNNVRSVSCLLEQLVTREEQKQADYDLKAQQEMAEWAFALLLTSIVGVVLIALTLLETRAVLGEAGKTTEAANRTVEETRRIGETQIRAYLNVKEPRFELGDALTFHFKIFNSGHSPAYRVAVEQFSVKVLALLPEMQIAQFEFNTEEDNVTRHGGIITNNEIPFSMNVGFLSEDVQKMLAAAEKSKLFSLYGKGQFVFKDVFGFEIVQPFMVTAELRSGGNVTHKAAVIFEEPPAIRNKADSKKDQ